MTNPLSVAALDNNSVAVPIGVNIFTNKRPQNSKNVQVAMTGAEMKAPIYTMIDAPGHNGEQAFRTNEDVMYFDTPLDRDGQRIAEVNFDDAKGTLTIVRKNGTTIVASSFLRQIDFGVGPTGPRGDLGKDGDDAEDGEDGKDGDGGCAGFQGAEGRVGDDGDDGAEGEVGSTGPIGPIGPTGPRGDIGVQGAPGFEGKRGLCGFTCPTTSVGPCGPTGPTMNKNAQTKRHPTSLDLIWAAPEDCLCPDRPFVVRGTPVNPEVEFY